MNILTHIEKQKLERELRMSGGYVLNFSNRTFQEFFREVVKIDIYDPRYDRGSGSKANRLRAFWDVATNSQIISMLNGLLDGWEIYAGSPISNSSQVLVQQILHRLGGGQAVPAQPPPRPANVQIGEEIARLLAVRLVEISGLPPQRRGYEFEGFLKKLFDAYGLSGRASFRLTGEQIDGSFVMDHETYLLEARWQNAPTDAADLHTFQGKLGQKAAWSRGLFVSISGFTEDGLHAFGRGKSIICMDGCDLSEILMRKMSFVEVLALKVRRAAETGVPFIRVRDLNL